MCAQKSNRNAKGSGKEAEDLNCLRWEILWENVRNIICIVCNSIVCVICNSLVCIICNSVYKNVLHFLCRPKYVKCDDSIFKRCKKYKGKIK